MDVREKVDAAAKIVAVVFDQTFTLVLLHRTIFSATFVLRKRITAACMEMKKMLLLLPPLTLRKAKRQQPTAPDVDGHWALFFVGGRPKMVVDTGRGYREGSK
jgi:hypothetical protein